MEYKRKIILENVQRSFSSESRRLRSLSLKERQKFYENVKVVLGTLSVRQLKKKKKKRSASKRSSGRVGKKVEIVDRNNVCAKIPRIETLRNRVARRAITFGDNIYFVTCFVYSSFRFKGAVIKNY